MCTHVCIHIHTPGGVNMCEGEIMLSINGLETANQGTTYSPWAELVPRRQVFPNVLE